MNRYFQLVELTKKIDASYKAFDGLALMAKKLLEIIAVRHHNDQPMTVGDIMSLSALGSPATLHRKLDDLREAGLIDMVFEAGNRRTKYLVPTKEAYRYFDQMGKALATAVKAG